MATRQFGLTVHCARQGEAEVVQGDASVLERAHLQDFIVVYEHSTRGAMRTTNMEHDSLSNLLNLALRPSMQYKAPRRAREFLVMICLTV